MSTYKVEFTKDERDAIMAALVVMTMVEMNEQAAKAFIGMEKDIHSIIQKLTIKKEAHEGAEKECGDEQKQET